MNYLFFDIEHLSEQHRSESIVCSFGYVLTDEQFNLIKEENIIIKPRIKQLFHDDFRILNDVIKMDYKTFEKAEDFSYYYHDIKKLMEDDNTIVFGIETDCDMSNIGKDCQVFNLKPIVPRVYNLQVIFNMITNNNDTVGLTKLADLYKVDYDKSLCHNALYDAKLTMAVGKAMALKAESSLIEIIKQKDYNEYKSKMNQPLAKMKKRINNIKESYQNEDIFDLINRYR